jgi:hypothetical protein
MTARVQHDRSHQPPRDHAGIKVCHLSLPRPECAQVMERDLQICVHGLRMKTRWPFAFGAELELVVSNEGHQVRWEGVVVGCQRRLGEAAAYDTLVYCPDFPQEATVKGKSAQTGEREAVAKKRR